MSRPALLRSTSYLFAAFGLAVAGVAIALPAAPVAARTATAAQPGRPAADKAQDIYRKPGMMVRFAGIKRGNIVVEILPGEGYFTRVFSNAVGPRGRVYATELRDPAGAQAIAAEPGRGNIKAYAGKPGDIAPKGVADVVWTSRNYHDLKGPKVPADTAGQVNKAAFAALKPGGYYIVLDHSAAVGSGLRDVDTLHRIDAEAVKAEVLAAGFEFAGETALLANAADTRTLPVFDDAIKGRTDQFVLRFRKPR